MLKLTQEQVIQKMKNVHGDKYDYSLVDYKTIHDYLIIICPIHGKFEQKLSTHIIKKCGCPTCGRIKAKQTCLEKYGVDNPSKSSIIQQKIKQTFNTIYGCHPTQTIEIQNKFKNTCLEKYGVDNPRKSIVIKETIKQTILTRYSGHPSQNKEIQEKIKQTMLTRYGVRHPKHINKSPEISILSNHNWLFDQYVVLGKSAQQIAKDLQLNNTTILNYLHFYEISIRYGYSYSCKSIMWLDQIMEQEGILIQHALNVGEYQIPGTRLKADGFCVETNTIYEFYGDYWHGNPETYLSEVFNKSLYKNMGSSHTKTINREMVIRSLGYNLICIWEKEFDNLHY